MPGTTGSDVELFMQRALDRGELLPACRQIGVGASDQLPAWSVRALQPDADGSDHV